MTFDPMRYVGKPYHPVDYNCYSLVCEVTGLPNLDVIAKGGAGDTEQFERWLTKLRFSYVDVAPDEAQTGDLALLGKAHIGVVNKEGADTMILHATHPEVRYDDERILKAFYGSIRYVRWVG